MLSPDFSPAERTPVHSPAIIHTQICASVCTRTLCATTTIYDYQNYNTNLKGGYTLVTLPRIATPYRDSVDGTRGRVTYQKLVTR
jgi:hypothetical protein